MRLREFWLSTVVAALLCQCVVLHAAEEAPTRLLRQPAVSKDHLAFVYGGNIWVSDRDGSHPVQITSHPASEFAPHFSPDGKWIAFSANYDNNTDVYVVPVEGGQPRRLTWWIRTRRRSRPKIFRRRWQQLCRRILLLPSHPIMYRWHLRQIPPTSPTRPR